MRSGAPHTQAGLEQASHGGRAGVKRAGTSLPIHARSVGGLPDRVAGIGCFDALIRQGRIVWKFDQGPPLLLIYAEQFGTPFS